MRIFSFLYLKTSKSHSGRDSNEKFPLGPFQAEIITWTSTQISRKKQKDIHVYSTLSFSHERRNDKKNLFHHPFFSSSKSWIYLFFMSCHFCSLRTDEITFVFGMCSHDLWISNWNVNGINFFLSWILGRLSLWISPAWGGSTTILCAFS
jgi:hypothetical protein